MCVNGLYLQHIVRNAAKVIHTTTTLSVLVYNVETDPGVTYFGRKVANYTSLCTYCAYFFKHKLITPLINIMKNTYFTFVHYDVKIKMLKNKYDPYLKIYSPTSTLIHIPFYYKTNKVYLHFSL